MSDIDKIKITKNKTKPKKAVMAYGEVWHIPKWADWIAIDEDGTIYAHKDKPVVSYDDWFWGEGKIKRIGQADLNGVDWRETLIEVLNVRRSRDE